VHNAASGSDSRERCSNHTNNASHILHTHPQKNIDIYIISLEIFVCIIVAGLTRSSSCGAFTATDDRRSLKYLYLVIDTICLYVCLSVCVCQCVRVCVCVCVCVVV
jgi:hypothetical protein